MHTYTVLKVLQVLVSAVQFRPVSPSAPPRPWRQISLEKPWRSSNPILLGSTQYVACIGSMLSVIRRELGGGGEVEWKGVWDSMYCARFVCSNQGITAHMICLTDMAGGGEQAAVHQLLQDENGRHPRYRTDALWGHSQHLQPPVSTGAPPNYL